MYSKPWVRRLVSLVDAAPAFSDSVRLSVWTDVLRVQSGKAGLVSVGEK